MNISKTQTKSQKSKLSKVFGLVFAPIVLVLGFVFAFAFSAPKSTLVSSAQNPEHTSTYGEVRVHKQTGLKDNQNRDIYATLVYASENTTTSGRFAFGATIDVFVVTNGFTIISGGEHVPTTALSTFGSGNNWNAMVSKLYLAGEEQLLLRTTVQDALQNNLVAGAYKTYNSQPIYNGQNNTGRTENRYKIFSFQANASADITVEFAQVQNFTFTTYEDGSKQITTTYAATNGEDLSQTITQNKFTNSGKTFFGYYDANGNLISNEESLPQIANASEATKSISLVFFTTNQISLSTQTFAKNQGENGGTATVTTTNSVAGKADATNFTKYFPNGLSTGSTTQTAAPSEYETYKLPKGTTTFMATAHKDYVFLGWYSYQDGAYTFISANPTVTIENGPTTFANNQMTKDGAFVVARFAAKQNTYVSSELGGSVQIFEGTSQSASETVSAGSSSPAGYFVFANSYTLLATSSASSDPKYSFDGFYYVSATGTTTKITSQNITDICGEGAQFVSNGKISFVSQNNLHIIAKFVQTHTITINLFGTYGEDGALQTIAMDDTRAITVSQNGNNVSFTKNDNSIIFEVLSGQEATITISTNGLPFSFSTLTLLGTNSTTLVEASRTYDLNQASQEFTFSTSKNQTYSMVFALMPIEAQLLFENGTSLNATVFPAFSYNRVQNQESISSILGILLHAQDGTNQLANAIMLSATNGNNTFSVTFPKNTAITGAQQNGGITLTLADMCNALLSSQAFVAGTRAQMLKDFAAANSQQAATFTTVSNEVIKISLAASTSDANQVSQAAQSALTAFSNGSAVGTNLSGSFLTTSGTTIKFVAASSFTDQDTVWVFSHFSENGNLIASTKDYSLANGGQIVKTASGYSLTVEVSNAFTLTAVYKKQVSVTFQSKTNGTVSQNSGLTIKQLENNNFATTLNTSFATGTTIKVSAPEFQNNAIFTNFTYTIGGESTVTSSRILTFEVQSGIQVVANYASIAVYNPQDQNSLLLLRQITGANQTLTSTIPNGAKVTASETEVPFGSTVRLFATAPEGYVFVGYYSVPLGSQIAPSTMALITIEPGLSIEAGKTQIVAVFAKGITISASTNTSSDVVTITSSVYNSNSQTFSSQDSLVSYQGAQITLWTGMSDFGGYFDVRSDIGTKISSNATHSFTVGQSIQNYVALKADQNLVVRVQTNGSISSVGGKVSATLATGEAFQNQTELNLRFASLVGKNHTLVAKPNTGYEFVGWFLPQQNGITADKLISKQATITLPAISSSSLVAKFAKFYSVTTTATGEVGGIIMGAPENGKAEENSVLNLFPLAHSGYYFAGWTITMGGVQTTNPNANLSITITQDTTISANFLRLKEITATSNLSELAQTITIDGQTTNTVFKQNGEETQISITVNDSEYQFLGAQNNAGVSASSTQQLQNGKLTITLTINANSNDIFTLLFARKTSIVCSIITNGDQNNTLGGTISIDGVLASAQNPIASGMHTVSAAANPNYTLVGFQIGSTFMPVSGGQNSIELNVSGNVVVSAMFKQKITITTNVGSGSGAVSMSNDASQIYYGDTINLSFVPAAGYITETVSGLPAGATKSLSGASFVATQNETITANFVASAKVSTTSNESGANVCVLQQFPAFDTTVSGQIAEIMANSAFTLQAELETNGKVFVGFYKQTNSGFAFESNGTYSVSDGRVSLQTTANQNCTYVAQYEPYSTVYMRLDASIDQNMAFYPATGIKNEFESSNFTLSLALPTSANGTTQNASAKTTLAPWFAMGATVFDTTLQFHLPKTLATTLNCGLNQNWYFVSLAADTTQNVLFNINLVSNSATMNGNITFVAADSSIYTQNVYLLATQKAPQSTIETTASPASLYTAAATQDGKPFTGFEIQFGVSLSKTYLRLSPEHTSIALTENGNETYTITDTATSATLYCGYVLSVRATYGTVASQISSNMPNFHRIETTSNAHAQNLNVFASTTANAQTGSQSLFAQSGTTVHVFATSEVATKTQNGEVVQKLVFVGWYEGDTLLSQNATYSFVASASKSLQARYEQQFKVVFSHNDVTTNTSNICTIEDANGNPVQNGSFVAGNTALTFVAKKLSTYEQIGWNAAGAFVLSAASSSEQGKTINLTVSQPLTITAIYQASVLVTLKTQGISNASGIARTNELAGSAAGTVNEVLSNEDIIFVANPNDGSVFDGWYEVITGQAEPSLLSIAGYTAEQMHSRVLVITANKVAGKTIVARFRLPATVSISTNLPGTEETNTKVYSVGLGVGQTVTLVANDATGYKFDHFESYINGNWQVLQNNKLTLQQNNQIRAIYTRLGSVQVVVIKDGVEEASMNLQLGEDAKFYLAAASFEDADETNAKTVFVGWQTSGQYISQSEDDFFIPSFSDFVIYEIHTTVRSTTISGAQILLVPTAGLIQTQSGTTLSATAITNSQTLFASTDAMANIIANAAPSDTISAASTTGSASAQNVYSSSFTQNLSLANSITIYTRPTNGILATSNIKDVQLSGSCNAANSQTVTLSFTLPQDVSTTVQDTTHSRALVFVGWYKDGQKVSDSSTYTFTATGNAAICEARFEEWYLVSLDDISSGAASAQTTATYINAQGNTVTIYAGTSTFVAAGTTLTIRSTSTNDFVTKITANDLCICELPDIFKNNQEQGSALSCTIVANQALNLCAHIAKSVSLQFNLSSGIANTLGGTIGISSAQNPAQKQQISNLVADQNGDATFTIFVPFSNAQTIVLQANSALGMQLNYWQIAGVQSHETAKALTPNQNQIITAAFIPSYQLTTLVITKDTQTTQNPALLSVTNNGNNSFTITFDTASASQAGMVFSHYETNAGDTGNFEFITNNTQITITLTKDTTIRAVVSRTTKTFTASAICANDQNPQGFQPSLTITDQNNAQMLAQNGVYNLFASQTYKIQAGETAGYAFSYWRTITGTHISNSPVQQFTTNSLSGIVAVYSKVAQISVSSNNDQMGTAIGDGTYAIGNNATLVATPKAGYMFSAWKNADTNAVLSQNQTYSFQVQEDVNIQAVFVQSASVLISTTSGGSVSGAYSSVWGTHTGLVTNSQISTVVPQGSIVTLVATAQKGFTFVGWYVEDAQISTDTQYNFSANTSTTIEARFAKAHALTFITSVLPNNTQNNVQIEVSGATNQQKIAHGTEVTFGFTNVPAGHNLVSLKINGEQQLNNFVAHASIASTIFNLTVDANYQIEAVFALPAHNIEVSLTTAAEVPAESDHSVTITCITPTGTTTEQLTATGTTSTTLSGLHYGDKISLVATPSASATISDWLVIDDDSNTELRSSAITLDAGLVTNATANFVLSQHSIKIYFPESVSNFQSNSPYQQLSEESTALYVFIGGTLHSIISKYGVEEVNPSSSNIISETYENDYYTLSFPHGEDVNVQFAFGTYINSASVPFFGPYRHDITCNGIVFERGKNYGGNMPFVTALSCEIYRDYTFVPTYDQYQLVQMIRVVDGSCPTSPAVLIYQDKDATRNATQLNATDGAQLLTNFVKVGSTINILVEGQQTEFNQIVVANNHLQDYHRTSPTSTYWEDAMVDKYNNLPNVDETEKVADSGTLVSFLLMREDCLILVDFTHAYDKSSTKMAVFSAFSNDTTKNPNSGHQSSKIENGKSSGISKSYGETTYGGQTLSYAIVSLSRADEILFNHSTQQNNGIGSNGILLYSNNAGHGQVHIEEDGTTTHTANNNAEYNLISDSKTGKYYFTDASDTIVSTTLVTTTVVVDANQNAQNKLVAKKAAAISSSGSMSDASSSTEISDPDKQSGSYVGTTTIGQRDITITAPLKNGEENFVCFAVVPNGADISRRILLPHTTQNDNAVATVSLRATNFDVMAIYEKDLYLIDLTKQAAYKTGLLEDGEEQQITIAGIHTITIKNNAGTAQISEVEGTGTTYANNILTTAGETTKITNTQKVTTDAGTFFTVFTNAPTSNGTVKGSLVFEHGDTTSISPSVYLFGEFAGFEFEETRDYTIEITSTGETMSPTSQTFTPAFRNQAEGSSKAGQTLKTRVENDFKMYTYFTSMSYLLTIKFAEVQTDSTKPQDIISLVCDSNAPDANEHSTQLASLTRYLELDANGKMTNKLKAGLVSVVIDDETELPLKVKFSTDNTITQSGTLTLSTLIESEAGSGFKDFEIVFNNDITTIVGYPRIISPQETSEHDTIDTEYWQNDTAHWSVWEGTNQNLSYNNNIGSQEEVSASELASLVKNPTVVLTIITQPTSITSTNETNSDQTGTTVMVLKTAGIILNQLIGMSDEMDKFNSFVNLIPELYQLQPNNDEYYNKLREANNTFTALTENDMTKYKTSSTFVNLIKTYYEITQLSSYFELQNNLKDSSNEFVLANKLLADPKANPDGYSYFIRLKDGHYAELKYNDSSFSLKNPDAQTKKLLGIKDLESCTIEYELTTGTISVIYAGKETYTTQLIVRKTLTLTSGIVVADFSLFGNCSSPVFVDQDDMVIARTNVQSHYSAEYYEGFSFLIYNKGTTAFDYFINQNLKFNITNSFSGDKLNMFSYSGQSQIRPNEVETVSPTTNTIWDFANLNTLSRIIKTEPELSGESIAYDDQAYDPEYNNHIGAFKTSLGAYLCITPNILQNTNKITLISEVSEIERRGNDNHICSVYKIGGKNDGTNILIVRQSSELSETTWTKVGAIALTGLALFSLGAGSSTSGSASPELGQLSFAIYDAGQQAIKQSQSFSFKNPATQINYAFYTIRYNLFNYYLEHGQK